MNESGAGAAAPMSREGIDHALRDLRAEQEKISTALLDLEGHDGTRLLKGARLAGETWRRWEDARAEIAMVWRLYDAYQKVLDTAAELRDRHQRPGAAVLVELTGLLAGESVEVPDGEIPLERRTLLGASQKRITLAEAVSRMSGGYARAAEVIAAADTAWTALLVPLEDIEETWRETARLAQGLDGSRHPELDRLGRELSALGQAARTDPLSLVRDGQVDTGRLHRLREALEALRASLAEAVRLRDGYEQRLAEVTASIADVEEAETRAREARTTATLKIDSARLPEPPALGTGLRHRLAGLETLRRAGRWAELAARVAELDRATGAALEQARDNLRLSTGLLDRRGELRGRLDAYKAKAGRLGFAEDERLAELYGKARELLWTSPCDLRRATAALAEYQRAIKARESGTEPGR
ncbi:hypothetical protein GCM10023085_09950 [Actinomadura viridis]|uniref:Uncharacterized protein n=1 Tax=Actinomadura viridis TaxID=58110 RepID=A0A931DQM2_9ACTN|nr:hypothetical protein [Actinomadura viridis]MBG6092006.1 hypothetical protein [Actinomadura viridis]